MMLCLKGDPLSYFIGQNETWGRPDEASRGPESPPEVGRRAKWAPENLSERKRVILGPPGASKVADTAECGACPTHKNKFFGRTRKWRK